MFIVCVSFGSWKTGLEDGWMGMGLWLLSGCLTR